MKSEKKYLPQPKVLASFLVFLSDRLLLCDPGISITQWLEGWKKKGWKTAAKKPVKNQDLWIRLDELSQFHNVNWKWVKGHSGHRENEIADLLANKGIDEL